jgi:hypothetical protein
MYPTSMPLPFGKKRTTYFAPYSDSISSIFTDGREETHEAITNATNLLETLLLQPLDALLNNRIHMLICMRVVSACPLREPSREIKVRRPIQAQWITVEQVGNERIVSVSGKLVGYQLRVLPDADHVGEEEYGGVFVDIVSCRLSDVGLDVADFDGFAGRLAAGVFINSHSRINCINCKEAEVEVVVGKTYSCLTPTVQQVEGGLDAILYLSGMSLPFVGMGEVNWVAVEESKWWCRETLYRGVDVASGQGLRGVGGFVILTSAASHGQGSGRGS